MNFDFLKDQFFLEAIEQNKPFLFKQVGIPELSWDDILQELNDHVQNHKRFESRGNMRYVLYEMESKIVNQFNNEFSKVSKTSNCESHCYINLMRQSGETGYHSDSKDILFWQMQGRTHWRIGEIGSNRDYFTLTPGDALYVPARVFHEVISMTARVGISFG